MYEWSSGEGVGCEFLKNSFKNYKQPKISFAQRHRIEINRKATRVGTFEVCVSTHVSLRMFIMQVLASQLPFLANGNAELAVPPLFWPDKCIKIGGHVALLSGATVYTLYCVKGQKL